MKLGSVIITDYEWLQEHLKQTTFSAILIWYSGRKVQRIAQYLRSC